MSTWLDITIIVLAIVAGIFLAIIQAIAPWWIALILLTLLIASRVEILFCYRNKS